MQKGSSRTKPETGRPRPSKRRDFSCPERVQSPRNMHAEMGTLAPWPSVKDIARAEKCEHALVLAVVKEMKRVCKPGGYLVFLNHFQSENPFFGTIEKLYSPLCYRLGFKTDLNLRKLMDEAGVKIETCEPISVLWKAVRCINP